MINNPLSLADIRFNLVAAVLAYKWSHYNNGATHETTRRLMSQVEFAEAFLESAMEAISND